MSITKDDVIFFLGSALTTIVWGWGLLHPMIHVLLGMMLLNTLSGIAVASRVGTLSPGRALRGAHKSVMILLLVSAAVLIEYELSAMVGLGAPISSAAAGFYSAYLLVSMLKNAVAIGLPVPSGLRKAVSSLSPDEEPVPRGKRLGTADP